MCIDKKDILLKEWEKNVDLYIDQDKRGFERITMFLVINAGLFALYGTIYSGNTPQRFLLCIIAVVGIYIVRITKRMSVRAHSYILLRKAQGMLIEEKLKNLPGTPGTLTTFTREHAVFQLDDTKWEGLKKEIKRELSRHVAKPFNPHWDKYTPIYKCIKNIKCYQKAIEWYKRIYKSVFKEDLQPTIGHLAWLIRIYATLYVLWIILFCFAFSLSASSKNTQQNVQVEINKSIPVLVKQ